MNTVKPDANKFKATPAITKFTLSFKCENAKSSDIAMALATPARSPIQGFFMNAPITLPQNAAMSIMPSMPMFIEPEMELTNAAMTANKRGVETLSTLYQKAGSMKF
jgi:hypothetical protein